jgi:transposase
LFLSSARTTEEARDISSQVVSVPSRLQLDRLAKALERLLACKPTDAQGRKVRDAVALDCRGKLFVFLRRRDAEPTNNASERALRPSVIFRKVTNGFRSRWGAKAYAALCSIVETGRRNGRSALTAIRDALAAPVADAAAA